MITTPENNSSTELREDEMPRPQVEIVRIPSLANRACLEKVSCMQMTDTGLFLNWDPDLPSNDEHDTDEDLFYSSLHDEIRYASKWFCLVSVIN